MLLVLALAAVLVPASPPPALTIAQAVTQARASSPLRKAPLTLIQGLTDAERLSGRLLNPLVDVRVENFTLAGQSPLPNDVFAIVSQPVELGGKRGLRLNVASADLNVARTGLQIADWQIALRTAHLYLQALKARGLLDTLTANRESLTTLVDTMRRRVEEGLAAEADLLKFETESARMDIDIARAAVELERSLSVLSYIIGAATPLDAAQLVEPPSIEPPRVEMSSLPGAVARHPELQQAVARYERLQQGAALERARRLPDPVVTAGYKRTAGFDTAVAGVTMTIPLFDRNGSASAKAEGEARAAAAEREALATRLVSDAAALLATAQVLSDKSKRVEKELLTPADVVRNAARASFQEGSADVLRLIDAERVYSDVRRTALELRLEALAAVLDARFAIGEETIP